MFGMQLSEILTFTVIGALVTTFGNLTALYLKDVLAVRSFERWKARQTLTNVYRRYQLPIFLTAEELSGRLYVLSQDSYEAREFNIGILKKDIARDTHALAAEHYYQYRFISNIYRLCSFLGWIELYRRDIGTLDVEALDKNHLLESSLRNIRSAIADGWINQHGDIERWSDCLIFREELRAIGNRMTDGQKELCVLDFGGFFETLKNDPDGANNARWFYQAALFFNGLQYEKDFRIIRMRMLVIFLTDLMEILQPKRIRRAHIATALSWFDELNQITGGDKWHPKDVNVQLVKDRLKKALGA